MGTMRSQGVARRRIHRPDPGGASRATAPRDPAAPQRGTDQYLHAAQREIGRFIRPGDGDNSDGALGRASEYLGACTRDARGGALPLPLRHDFAVALGSLACVSRGLDVASPVPSRVLPLAADFLDAIEQEDAITRIPTPAPDRLTYEIRLATALAGEADCLPHEPITAAQRDVLTQLTTRVGLAFLAQALRHSGHHLPGLAAAAAGCYALDLEQIDMTCAELPIPLGTYFFAAAMWDRSPIGQLQLILAQILANDPTAAHTNLQAAREAGITTPRLDDLADFAAVVAARGGLSFHDLYAFVHFLPLPPDFATATPHTPNLFAFLKRAVTAPVVV